MRDGNDTKGQPLRAETSGGDSIRELVLQEAAAAIVAAGRELSSGEPPSVRDFLRGPALKVGLALSVMGVTMWIVELNQEHKRRHAAAERKSTGGSAGAERSRGSKRGSRNRAHVPMVAPKPDIE